MRKYADTSEAPDAFGKKERTSARARGRSGVVDNQAAAWDVVFEHNQTSKCGTNHRSQPCADEKETAPALNIAVPRLQQLWPSRDAGSSAIRGKLGMTLPPNTCNKSADRIPLSHKIDGVDRAPQFVANCRFHWPGDPVRHCPRFRPCLPAEGIRRYVPGLYFLGLPWQHRRGSALLGFVHDMPHPADPDHQPRPGRAARRPARFPAAGVTGPAEPAGEYSAPHSEATLRARLIREGGTS